MKKLFVRIEKKQILSEIMRLFILREKMVKKKSVKQNCAKKPIKKKNKDVMQISNFFSFEVKKSFFIILP